MPGVKIYLNSLSLRESWSTKSVMILMSEDTLAFSLASLICLNGRGGSNESLPSLMPMMRLLLIKQKIILRL